MEDGVNLRIFINHIKADNVSLVKKKHSQSVGVLPTTVGKVLLLRSLKVCEGCEVSRTDGVKKDQSEPSSDGGSGAT